MPHAAQGVKRLDDDDDDDDVDDTLNILPKYCFYSQ
jgi:hypothetical protein